jgi:hypothetical protein
MSTELFDPITIGDPSSPSLLAPMRQELQRELSAAIRAVDEVPEWFLDADAARELFRELCDDGDADAARDQLRDAFEMSAGFARHFDRLLDHINTMSWAYWRLHRAERRAYQKGGTQ